MSTQTKNTPGPWKQENNFLVTAKDGKSTLVIHHTSPVNTVLSTQELSANAKLIAAAPELLEALQDLLEIAENYKVEGPYMKKAIAAITKATE